MRFDCLSCVKMSVNVANFNQFLRDPNKTARSLVKKITHSGETDLIKDELKELKEICKTSGDDLMLDVYKECMKCLKKEHSQVRVSTVKLLDYIFQKSHVLRGKLLDDFDVFIELTLSITQRPKVKLHLPPPKKYAALLKELTAKAIHRWHADFGDGYEKLRYAHRFLKEHQLVDFSRFQVNTHEQLIKQQKLAERQENTIIRLIENRMKEYRELKPEIQQILAQIESLIDILFPRVGDAIDAERDTQLIDPQYHRQHHGIANLSQNLDIEFSPYLEIKRSADNEDIVRNLRELKKELIGTKLVKLIAIEKTINKRSDRLLDTVKEIIDIKAQATNLILKLGELKIVDDEGLCRKVATIDNDTDEDDEEDDFEDVSQKEDLETYIPKSMRYEYGLEPIDPKEVQISNRVILNEESFSSDEPGPSSRSATSSLILSCNVRMETGKLCTRRDKIKCPFHGKIIARDHLGVPIDEELRKEEEKRAKRRNDVPDWQDPQLLQDIKAATGIDLTMPKKGASRKVSPKKTLVNPRTCDLTPKQRLERKLRTLS